MKNRNSHHFVTVEINLFHIMIKARINSSSFRLESRLEFILTSIFIVVSFILEFVIVILMYCFWSERVYFRRRVNLFCSFLSRTIGKRDFR